MNESSGNQGHPEERQWEPGWDEHEKRQRLRMSRLPLSEKLLWLEQAQRTAMHLQASNPSPAKHRDPLEDQAALKEE